MNFKEEIFEIAFGDNAINKGYSEEEVIKQIRKYSDKSFEMEEIIKIPIYWFEDDDGKKFLDREEMEREFLSEVNKIEEGFEND